MTARAYILGSLPIGPNGYPSAATCPDCGALVLDTGTHNTWHDQQAPTLRKAAR